MAWKEPALRDVCRQKSEDSAYDKSVSWHAPLSKHKIEKSTNANTKTNPECFFTAQFDHKFPFWTNLTKFKQIALF